MYEFMIFLHVIGAVGLGFYLIIPLLLLRVYKLTGSPLEGYLSGLYATSRIMQYLLIVQLLTGGYLMAKLPYSTLWMVLTILFFIVVGAISGMLNGKMKKAIKDLNSGGNGSSYMRSIKIYSYITSVSMLIVLYFMMYPTFG
jgi:hypothetical protein